MTDSEQRAFYLELLADIVSQPTAPFHEERVAARIAAYLREWGIPYALDDAGNLIARYQRGPACRALVLMAHMDHPAFTITARGGPDGADLTAALEGGVAARCFARPVTVRVMAADAPDAAAGLPARIVGYQQGATPRDVELHLRLDDPAAARMVAPGDFGIWDLPDFAVRDGVIHARAIDDLAGCAAALLALWHVAREQCDTTVYGVFTRAEEVGLIGADVVLRNDSLPADAYIVSLEASKALPGALQGEGPVIRAGDRVVTFSEEAELALKAAAQNLGSNVWQPSVTPTARVQRQLMSGGRCEASTAVVRGYRATGLAFPLGNYHNVTDDATLAPENIHVQDYLTGVALLQEAACLMPRVEQVQAEQAARYTAREDLVARLTASVGAIRAAVDNS